MINANAMSTCTAARKFIRLILDVDVDVNVDIGDCCGSVADVMCNLENDTMFLFRDGRPCACIGWSFMMMDGMKECLSS